MAIAYRCPKCDHVVYAPITLKGKAYECPKCQEKAVVPKESRMPAKKAGEETGRRRRRTRRRSKTS